MEIIAVNGWCVGGIELENSVGKYEFFQWGRWGKISVPGDGITTS